MFEEDALQWIAGEAIKRGTGARALRAILEEFMLDIMYEIPKDPNIGSVVVTRLSGKKRRAFGADAGITECVNDGPGDSSRTALIPGYLKKPGTDPSAPYPHSSLG